MDRLGGDWKSFVQSLAKDSLPEVELRKMKSGDCVLLKTRNTFYLLEWKTDDLVELRSNKAKAPSGPVQIMGCTFGQSSSIRPDLLTCGANLELTYNNGHRTWTTSVIDEIHYLHRTEG